MGGGGLANDAPLATILHQIVVFDEKVRKFKDGYSVDTARQMFTELAHQFRPAAHAARSVARLRALVADRRVVAAPSGGGAAADQMRQYFAWYLKNLDYAADLRRNFENLILSPLSLAVAAEEERSPRPAIAASAATPAAASYGSSASVRDRTGARPRPDADDRLAKALAALLSFADDVPELRELYDRSELDATRARLDRVLSAWSRLTGSTSSSPSAADGYEGAGDEDDEEVDVDPHLFSAESGFASARPRATEASAAPEPASAWLETWVRLLPDVAIKCEKASALARSLLDSVATRRRQRSDAVAATALARKLGRARATLAERMRGAERAADEAERRLREDSGDLETLLEREERSAQLGAALHALAQDAGRLRVAVGAVQRELDDTLELLGTTTAAARVDAGAASFRDKLRETSRLKQRRLQALEQTLASVDFRRRVVEEDAALELNVKPSIIQFTNHVQERCERLEQEVERAQDERSRLSLALGLLERDESRLQLAAAHGGRSAAAAGGVS